MKSFDKRWNETFDNLRSLMPNADVKRLARLHGSRDLVATQNMKAYALGVVYRCQPHLAMQWTSGDEHGLLTYRNSLEALASVSALQAYRILGHFPEPVVGEVYQKTKVKHDNYSMYQGTSFWLVNGALNLGLENHLRESVYGVYEGYYLLCLKRYELIKRLLEKHSVLDTRLSPLTWLFTEASLADGRYTGTQKDLSVKVKVSKKELYENLNTYIKNLAEGSPFSLKLDRTQDEFKYAWAIVDAWARETANTDTSFQRIFFKPYLAAYRNWNREQKKLSTPVAPGKPGPPLGKSFPPASEEYMRKVQEKGL